MGKEDLKGSDGIMDPFYNRTDEEPIYKIVSKKYDREIKQYIFTIETS